MPADEGGTDVQCEVCIDEIFEMDSDEEAVEAEGKPTAAAPTARQRMLHNLIHLPYRSWCDICVRGRGQADGRP